MHGREYDPPSPVGPIAAASYRVSSPADESTPEGVAQFTRDSVAQPAYESTGASTLPPLAEADRDLHALRQRLAEEATSAAAAREKEQALRQRSAELERLNALLRESAQALAEARTPDEICELFLLQAVRALRGTGGGLLEVVEDTEHRFAALVQGDEVVPRHVWQHLPLVTQNNRMSKEDRHGLMARLVRGEDVWFAVDDDFAAWAPEAAAFHRAQGNAAIAMWPFHVGGRVNGSLGIAFSHTVPLSDSQKQTLKALSSQASLALELNAMAKEVELAAVTREREKATQERAAELAKINEALTVRSRLLSVIAEVSTNLLRSGDFLASLHDALRIIGEAIGLSRVLLLERHECAEAPGRFEHRVTAEWCAPGIGTHADCGVNSIKDADAGQVLADLESGRSNWYHVEDVDGPMRGIFEQLKIKATGCTPVFVAGRYAGAITFDDCVQARTWEAAQVDALMVAANAVAAALQSRYDAERLARERERATQQRAAELAKANRALRRASAGLASASSPEEFLPLILTEAGDVTGALDGVIYRYESSVQQLRMVAAYFDGRQSESLPGHPFGDRDSPSPVGAFPAWAELIASGSVEFRPFAPSVDTQDLAKISKPWHISRGHTLVALSALIAEGAPLGLFGLAFRDRVELTNTDLEMYNALAQQATLALQMVRLAEDGRSAAADRAALQERNLLARDLHDTFAQGFAAILMQLGAADQAGIAPRTLLPYLNRIEDLARTNLAEARRTVNELRTTERVRDALLSRLGEMTRRLDTTYGISAPLNIKGARRALPPVVEDELYLIAQEAVTNAMKHADADEVKLEVEFDDGDVRLRVRDEGRGFCAEHRCKPGHFGLQTMQERSQRIDANLTIISEPGFGTEILVLWKDPSWQTR